MKDTQIETLAKAVSWYISRCASSIIVPLVTANRLVGVLYVLAWSLSFYPQIILNIRRRSTHGLMPDFPLLNVVGFSCYTFSTAVFLFSSTVREQYAIRHPHSPTPTVRGNDLAFGAHALVMCCIVYSQIWPQLWGWKKTPGVRRHATKVSLGLVWGSALGIAIVTGIVIVKGNGGDDANPKDWAWIDVVYGISFVKLLLTIFKYVPQAISNFRRKSTVGWSIWQILLDFTGGILSLLQLVIDSALQEDWSGLTGNPAKLGLANISLLFDVVFLLQHYVLFGPVEERHESTEVSVDHAHGPRQETDPLLPATR